MAVQQEHKAPPSRLTLLGALLALEVTAALAFGRVLQGRSASLRLALAAAVSVVLAGALERRHILLAVAVSAAGYLIFVGLVVFPDTIRFGLPTIDTLKAMRSALATVGATADVQPAPALPLAPLMLASITGVWTAAFSSHALAARARSPFLAIAPPGALLAFTSLVMGDGARPPYVLPFVASTLAVLFADGMWRVGQWGPVVFWHGRSSVLGAGVTTRGARRVALACLAVALFLPGLLPGYRSPGLVDVQGQRGPARVSINPIVDIRAQLLNNPDTEVLTVRTVPPVTNAPYWRFAVDDVFNGRQWLPADVQGSRGLVLDSGPVTLPRRSGASAADALTLQQDFTFERLYLPQLPAAFEPIDAELPTGGIRYNPDTGVLFDTNGTHPGFSYRVYSTVAVPSPEQLDRVTTLDDPNLDFGFFTSLPAALPRRIAQIAHDITDSQPTVYRKILALQNYLKGFRYSTNVPPGHSSSDILRFLEVTRAGYCEQFAGTMAVLLRALGIPARVAVGFTGGRFDRARGVWRVNSGNAHAWVEVPFPGFGWLTFDPTPGRADALAPYNNAPASFTNGAVAGNPACEEIIGFGGEKTLTSRCTGSRPGAVVPTPTPGGQGGRRAGAGGREGSGGTIKPPSHRGAWVLAALLGLALLLLLSIPAAKLTGRRLAVRRHSDPRARVLAAYRVLEAQAADVGLRRLPAETLLEYRARLRERVTSLDGDLDRLTSLTGKAAYGDAEITIEDVDRAMTAARQVAHDIRTSAGGFKRAAGWFRVEIGSRG